MNVVFLTGTDLIADKDRILEEYKKADTVFLLNDPTEARPLYRYIEDLKLKRNLLMRVRIARELTGLDAEYTAGGQTRKVDRLSGILNSLDPREESRVTILGDKDLKLETEAGRARRRQVRIALADVVQQLVYLELPLNKIQVCTEQEAQDMERVRIFERNLTRLGDLAAAADTALEEQRRRNPTWQEAADIKATVVDIRRALRDAMSTEMNIMVAATKKSGKSVLVNSMIEQELAPTSLLTPTPNNCIYRRRPDETYTLDFRGRHSEYQQADLPLMRGKIASLFREAERNVEAGFAIPDMELGYVKEQGGFTSYTLYDTPGPDLAGAVGHKEAKDRALKAADMVVFLIDFTKHLTDNEVAYLKEVRAAFENSGRFFSLVILVNKLDERFKSEGVNEKNVTYVLDYLRDSLITKDPSFQDVILLGSSALTFYRCINAPRLPDCACLEEENGLLELDSCIDHLRDMEEEREEQADGGFEEGTTGDDPVTTLDFLQGIAKSLRNHRGQEVHSLEELKAFSGMPNVLSYIDYIARNKARKDMVNNILSLIDGKVAELENLFQFQKLAETLSKNRGELDRVRQLLKDWTKAMDGIYDEDYPEVRQWVAERDPDGEQYGGWIRETGRKTPFVLSDTRDFAEQKMRNHLNEDGFIKSATEGDIPYYLQQNLTNLFWNAPNSKKIDGEKRTVVPEAAVIDCLVESMEKGVKALDAKMVTGMENAQGELNREYVRVQRFLTELLNDRRKRLLDTVEYYRRQINQGGMIPFEIPSPTFAFQFQEVHTQPKPIDLSGIESEMKTSIDAFIKKFIIHDRMNLNNTSRWVHRIKDLLRVFFRDPEKINRMCYDQEYVRVEVYWNTLREYVAASIRNSDLSKALDSQLQPLLCSLRDFFDELEREMRNNRQSAQSYVVNARRVLDTTGDMEREIHRIQERKEKMEVLHPCVAQMLTTWDSEIRNPPFLRTSPDGENTGTEKGGASQ